MKTASDAFRNSCSFVLLQPQHEIGNLRIFNSCVKNVNVKPLLYEQVLRSVKIRKCRESVKTA